VPVPSQRLASPIVRNKALWAALRAADVYQAITPGPPDPTDYLLVADCFEVTRRQGYAQIRGGPPLERPGHQRFERWQRTEQAGVDDLGKRDVLGPFGSTRRDPLNP
jgi:hypothetical protein